MAERETWTTRLGFILAAVGSAVGLGNIWRFPFQTAETGGGAFLVFYLLSVVLIGLPVLLAEFVIGRRAQVDAIGAFREIGWPKFAFIGGIGVFAAFWTLSYYSVVGGWVLRYILGSTTGAAFGNPESYFGAVSAGPEAMVAHALFMVVTIVIVAFGIERGIELATKFMVPSIVLLLIGLAVYALTLPGSSGGYSYFLNPEFGTLASKATTVLPKAMGQALFSLSVGFSVMITYASYIGQDDDLGIDGVSISITNTFIGVLAGLVVFPLLFAGGGSIPTEGGAGAVFIAIPNALKTLPPVVGKLVGIVFFVIVLIAALSSAISLLEAPVAYLIDEFEFDRLPTTIGLGGVIFLIGLLSASNTAWLDWFDGIGVTLLLPVTAVLVVVFVGWVLGRDAVDELATGLTGGKRTAWIWLWSVRTFVLLAIIVVLGLNLYDLFLTPDTGYYVIPAPLR